MPARSVVEQLPRLPDERDALLVLVEPGRLADEHQVGVRAPGAEHDLCSALRERATGAARGLLGVRSECGGALDGVHREVSLRRRPDALGRGFSGRSRTSRRSNRRRHPTDR